MEEIVRQTLLFDFYGELLTKHQQRIYEEVVCNDQSCSEVAQQEGISRQGVHDLVRRTHQQLEDYEEKLHMMERFVELRREVRSFLDTAQQCVDRGAWMDPEQAKAFAQKLLKAL